MRRAKGNRYEILVITLMIILVALGQISCKKDSDHPGQTNSDYPRLLMTSESVLDIRENLGNAPLFDQTLKEVIDEIDAILDQEIEAPIPKDMAGGYTHERHKSNFFLTIYYNI